VVTDSNEESDRFERMVDSTMPEARPVSSSNTPSLEDRSDAEDQLAQLKETVRVLQTSYAVRHIAFCCCLLA
jgi:hypothetical protein